jgi:hypothetical protein
MSAEKNIQADLPQGGRQIGGSNVTTITAFAACDA